MIDSTITLGNVLSAISIIVTLGLALAAGMRKMRDMNDANMERMNEYHRANSQRLTAVETKMDAIWEWFTKNLERRADRRRDDYGG